MRKYILLLCFLSIINFSNELSNNTYDIIYDCIIDIMKGMSKNDTQPFCSNDFKYNKSKIFDNFKAIIEMVIEREMTFKIISYAYKIIIFTPNCELINIIKFGLELFNMQKSLFEKIGLNTMKKAKSIENNLNNIIETKSFNDKIKYAGKILSCIFDVYF